MAMSIVKNGDYLQNKFIFCNNKILLTTSLLLPDDYIIQKCMDFQLIKDKFSEVFYNYTAFLLEDNAFFSSDYKWFQLREIFAQNLNFASLAARAIALLNWRSKTHFCSVCAGPLIDHKFETARNCENCGNIVFPSICPAIIVLIEKDGKILLARHANRNTNMYTCLAGYLEVGESAEECVIREVKEEVGIEIKNIRYIKTQSWPYPDQFMMGFTAQWKSGDIVLQQEELEEAKWFDPNNLPTIPNPGSLAWELINLYTKNT